MNAVVPRNGGRGTRWHASAFGTASLAFAMPTRNTASACTCQSGYVYLLSILILEIARSKASLG